MKLCIIGAGFTGTAALCEILKILTETQSNEIKAALKKDLEITVIEQGARFGCGYAYNPDIWSACHRLNHDAGSQQPPKFTAEDSIQDWQFRDFYNWLKENGRRFLKEHPAYAQELDIVDLDTWQPSLTEYYPRGLFGLYLEDVFEKTVARLKDEGIAIECLNNTKVSGYLYEVDIQQTLLPPVTLVCENSLTQQSIVSHALKGIKDILICTGHWQLPTPNHPRILSGIPAQEQSNCLNSIDVDKPFFVKGTGLTGVDYILQIAQHFGSFKRDETSQALIYHPHNPHIIPQIIAASRKGLLPNVRPTWTPPKDFQHWTYTSLHDCLDDMGLLRISELIPLIEKELHAQTGKAVDWEVLAGLKSEDAYSCLQEDLLRAKQGDTIFCTLSKMAYGDLKAHTTRSLAMFFMQFGGLFESLHPADKELFNTSFLSHYLRYLAPMSPINAEKLSALFDKRCLNVLKLAQTTCQVAVDDTHGIFVELTNPQNDQKVRTEIAAFFDATGQQSSVTNHPSPFIQQLLKDGYGSRICVAQNDQDEYRQYTRAGFGVKSHTMQIGLQHYQDLAISPFRMVGALVDSWPQDRGFATGSVDLMSRVVEDMLRVSSHNIHSSHSSVLLPVDTFLARLMQNYSSYG
jgi:uncharacterized NAD(P)/FAD-binding protein YdhS